MSIWALSLVIGPGASTTGAFDLPAPYHSLKIVNAGSKTTTTAGGENGVQIEQSLDARTRFWQAFADAAAAVHRNERPAGSVLDRD